MLLTCLSRKFTHHEPHLNLLRPEIRTFRSPVMYSTYTWAHKYIYTWYFHFTCAYVPPATCTSIHIYSWRYVAHSRIESRTRISREKNRPDDTQKEKKRGKRMNHSTTKRSRHKLARPTETSEGMRCPDGRLPSSPTLLLLLNPH